MIPLDVSRQLKEVDESLIKDAAEQLGGDNNFKKLLIYGNIYRKYDLEPIYLTTPDYQSYTVSCRETFGKRLH